MRRKFKAHPSQYREDKIKDFEILLQHKMEEAKTAYESKLIESLQSHGSPAIYSYIRSLSTHKAFPSVMNLNTKCAVTDEEKAYLFNEFFHSVFTVSPFLLPPVRDFKYPHSFMGEISVSELDVFEALSSLDVSKASGPDGICAKLLKHCAIALYQPLHYIFFLSLSQCYLPLEWRTHLIKPIFKSGDKSLIKNYRPISLLCIVSKVLERIVYKKIIDFVYNSISFFQFGFLKGRSTLQQMLLLFNAILSSDSQVDVIYLDFRKAFDSVAHNELLLKLWNFGICDNLWHWMRAYLSCRQQYVSVGQSRSSVLPVLSGIPQGSILGPLLFLIFINDLPSALSSSLVLLFADDAKCFMSVSSQSDCLLLQNDLSRLVEWSSTWSLFLNEDKCCTVHFTKNQSPVSFSYLINDQQIPSKSTQRDLGISVSSDLQWSSHYQVITSKAYKTLGMLRRTFSRSVNVSAKRLLYLLLIRSHLQYCSPLWHPHLSADVKRLESVQRRATKFILNDFTMNYKERLIHLNLLPLMMEFEISDIMFLVKSIKHPSDHFDIYKFIQFFSHSTRSSSSLKLRHCLSKNNTQSNFYFNRIPRLWNSIPPIDISLSLPAIKSNLRAHFWDSFLLKFCPYNPCTYHYLCPCFNCSKLPVHVHYN